jgi:hypothetical protein
VRSRCSSWLVVCTRCVLNGKVGRNERSKPSCRLKGRAQPYICFYTRTILLILGFCLLFASEAAYADLECLKSVKGNYPWLLLENTLQAIFPL